MVNDPRFKIFCDRKLSEIENGITIEEEVDKMMEPENLKIEVKDDDGQWVVWSE